MKSIFERPIRNFTQFTIFSLLLIVVLSVNTRARVISNALDGPDGNNNGICGQKRGQRIGSDKLEVVGLTSDQRLICFDEDDPQDAVNIGTISGFTTDSGLVGIDFRPATGELYGLGNAGGVYTLNLNTAAATLKARLNVALSGVSFGVDFNPTVDRLRIVSDNGQNLRANVDTGATLTDTPLNYTVGVPAPGITGVAYTNNDADPNTVTTLFNIDTVLDQLNIQAPPNLGTLNPTGKLKFDAGLTVGFDIYSKLTSGTTTDVRALASLISEVQTSLYLVNLFTGQASARGEFRAFDHVVDIAIPLNQ
jgi:hypothetical protein